MIDQSKRHISIIHFGGICLIISAALFVSWNALTAISGTPPSHPEQIAGWIDSNKIAISFSDEFLSFATFFLFVGLVGYGIKLWARKEFPILSVVAVSCVALAIFDLTMMNIFLGRLVYPVFGLVPSVEVLSASLSSYYGALHMFDLLFVAGSVVFGIMTYRSRRKIWFLIFGSLVAVSELVAAYPWIFLPEFVFVLRVPLHLGLILVGVGMIRFAAKQGTETNTILAKQPHE